MAAKPKSADAAAQSRAIIEEISQGIFAPVYLLMGEEPYYVDLTAGKIIDAALTEDERDFNQFVMYGLDTTVEDVIGNARRYPMFAERTLVVLREAQMLRNLDDLSIYTSSPLESTVLVIIYRGNLDKRKALYKSIGKGGRVLESPQVRDYEMARWIGEYYEGRGLSIEPDAASLLAESLGTDLGKVALETDKMLRNLPDGIRSITVGDVEANVGISREFSVFELTRQLSFCQADKALRTAAYMSSSAKFAMPQVTAALFLHFDRILKYEALLLDNPRPTPEMKAAALGVSPFFFREYDQAVRRYPLRKCMAAISLIKEYDYRGKGGDGDAAPPSELMKELVTKLLSI